MAHIAFGVNLGGVVRQFDRVEGVAGVVRRDRPAHVVKHEEFSFGTEVNRITHTGRLRIGEGLLGDRTRVAVVRLVGVGVHDIAEHEKRCLLIEGVDIGRLQIRAQLHVGFVDGLPAGDRRTIEHGAVIEKFFIDQVDVEGHVLEFALNVGEANVNILDVLFLDELENVCCGHI
ncbi:hypothetical protein MMA231_01845 [Asticcacaulis sp. MM231]